jgi:hypothetical protein
MLCAAWCPSQCQHGPILNTSPKHDHQVKHDLVVFAVGLHDMSSPRFDTLCLLVQGSRRYKVVANRDFPGPVDLWKSFAAWAMLPPQPSFEHSLFGGGFDIIGSCFTRFKASHRPNQLLCSPCSVSRWITLFQNSTLIFLACDAASRRSVVTNGAGEHFCPLYSTHCNLDLSV